MELEAYAQKNCVTLPSGKYIEREPKEFKGRQAPEYRNDPTEYKQAFESKSNAQKQASAGRPLQITNIGEWWVNYKTSNHYFFSSSYPWPHCITWLMNP